MGLVRPILQKLLIFCRRPLTTDSLMRSRRKVAFIIFALEEKGVQKGRLRSECEEPSPEADDFPQGESSTTRLSFHCELRARQSAPITMLNRNVMYSTSMRMAQTRSIWSSRDKEPSTL